MYFIEVQQYGLTRQLHLTTILLLQKGQSYFLPSSLWQAPPWGKVGFLHLLLAHSPGLKQYFVEYRSKVGSNLQTDLTG